MPLPPFPSVRPHTHEWLGGRCACGYRLLRSGMMVMYPSPRNSCGCECHYATDGAERPLAEFRVKHLSQSPRSSRATPYGTCAGGATARCGTPTGWRTS